MPTSWAVARSGSRVGRSVLWPGIMAVISACYAARSTMPNASVAALRVQADLVGTRVQLISIEARATDLATPVVIDLEATNGVAAGVLRIPAGRNRTIIARAFDDVGRETHEGAETVDVLPGINPTLRITLVPLTSEQPITVTVAGAIVTVLPSTATMLPSETMQLNASAVDADGSPLPGAIRWASLGPNHVTVDQTGRVTAHAPGDAEIVATWGDVGGRALVTVKE